MGFLQNTVIAVFILLNTFISGALGFLHLSQPYVVDAGQTTATTTQSIQPTPIWVPLSSIRSLNFFQRNGSIFFGGISQEYPGYLLENADSKSFLILENPDGTPSVIAKDQSHVYRESAIIADADPTTFTPLHESQGAWDGFERDKNNVYFTAYPIAGANPKTFVVLGEIAINDIEAGEYAKDNEHVYYSDLGADAPVAIADAEASKFYLVYPDPRDDGVFLEEQCGQGCFFDAEDGNHKYYLGKIVQ